MSSWDASIHVAEQCHGDNHIVDARSDIYALGVIAFELVTGRHPFKARTPPAMLLAHVNKEPPSPRSINPGVSEAIEKAILRALAKAQEDRFQTVDEFITALTGKAAATPACDKSAAPAFARDRTTARRFDGGHCSGRATSRITRASTFYPRTHVGPSAGEPRP